MVALGLYVSAMKMYIAGVMFPVESAIAVATGIGGVAALVLTLLSRGDGQKFHIARVVAAASLVIGIANVFFI